MITAYIKCKGDDWKRGACAISYHLTQRGKAHSYDGQFITVKPVIDGEPQEYRLIPLWTKAAEAEAPEGVEATDEKDRYIVMQPSGPHYAELVGILRPSEVPAHLSQCRDLTDLVNLVPDGDGPNEQ